MSEELSKQISEKISNLIESNMPAILADLKQAVIDRPDGEEFGEVTGAVKISLQTNNNSVFCYQLSLEWGRTKKTKTEPVRGTYDPDQMEFPEMEKPKKKSFNKKETGEFITSYAKEAGIKESDV
jgi:hypothetical protein